MLDDTQLSAIMPTLAAAKRALYLPHLNAAMRSCAIGGSMLRSAAFVAQLAHESGELRWMEEIWGPTDAQRRYEPPSDLAKRLGNTEPGDGLRFKGRGPIQITGRFNYDQYGKLLARDLIAEPALAATPELAFATAGLFWQRNGLNELADAQDFVAITKRINGGTNGLADRQKYYERAKATLATGFVPDLVATRSRSAPSGASEAQSPLTRGYEAVSRSERALKGAATRAAQRTAEQAHARSRRRVKG
ncbi:MAG TPA: glycoside hydrolase family 19 protein [Burkholderiaceae bacterium]|nr:glycoside hydrolase family 19 protein [Burkholderiaceae bacterium]